MKFLKILLPVALFFQVAAYAQFEGSIYRNDGAYLSSVKVTVDGVEKKMAWSGGVNNPQFAVPDLNHDGLTDLVIFEAYWLPEEKGIKTFINKGTAANPNYYYHPEFEYLFPYANKYLQMADYNCDLIPDLFHYGTAGLGICDGYYNSNNALTFENCRDIKYYHLGASPPTFVSLGNNVPAIVDFDHDDDLDLVSFSNTGAWIYLYKNIRKEKGFSCDTFPVQLRDVCWGRVLQPGPREHLLHQTCNNKPYEDQPKTTDGSNTLCLLDHDGDGDYDVLNGNSAYSDLQFLRNNKVQFGNGVDSMTWQDTTWQSGGTKARVPRHPLAAWIDIDADGDKDVLASPLADNSENYRNIQYYKNVGSDANPNFAYQTDTFLVDRMLDLGSNSFPLFYDYNKDGKIDLLVGAQGFYQPNGTFKSTIWYFENTGTGGNISFNLVNRDLLRVDTLGVDGASLAIGDLDNDGFDDLVVGHLNGTLSYYENFATSATSPPDWRLSQKQLRDKNAMEIDVSNNAAPLIYDIDADGKKDLLVGNEPGTITYYKNIGSAGQLNLEFVSNSLGGVKIEPDVPHQYTYSAPFIGKMDNTGKEYLMVGGGYGRLFRYDGFQGGNVSTPYSLIDTQYSSIRLPGKFLAPAIADLNSDGKYEMVIGNDKGGLFLYRQVWNVHVDEIAGETELQLYPNPVQRTLTIESSQPMSDAVVTIYDMVGQTVYSANITNNASSYTADLAQLKPGIYLCSLKNNGSVKIARFTKLN